jgi:23S rRNA pseudouridine2605 synthase
MGEATGFPVRRLARLSFAGITSEGLRPGEHRPLTVDELLELRKQYGVPKRIRGTPRAAEGSVRRSRSARTDHSGTKPRAAGTPAPRARGRGDR